MSYNYLPLDRKRLNFQQVKNLLDYHQLVSITFDAHERILKCREYLDKKHADYDPKQTEQLQQNLLTSHACGLGDEVPVDIVKLMLMLKIKSLGNGHSGVQIETVKRLMELYNDEIYPVVYTQGGGFTPLSHVSLPLIGMGEVYYKGEKRHAATVLQELNRQPVKLQSNEGLALISGTQFTSAYGLYALKRAEQLLKMADVVAALSFDAFDCRLEFLHAKIQSVSNRKGQAETAAVLNEYLLGSHIANQQKQHLQDPDSFQCIPRVHGASKDAFDYVLNIFLAEINAVTESPVIFPDDNLVLDGGNSNDQPLALALDFLCMAMSEISGISERRTCQLTSGQRGLPMFLIKNPPFTSGFEGLQRTAGLIAAENKKLSAHTSATASGGNHADYTSTGSNAAVDCLRAIDNVEKVLAIELLVAVQALQFRTPVTSSPYLEQVMTDLRQHLPLHEKDSMLHNDIIETARFISAYKL